MQIKEILHYFQLPSDDERQISDFYDDSRKVQKNSVFIALKNGNKHIEMAKKRGAILILSDLAIPHLEKELLALLLLFYKFQPQDLKIIGITGTNGKSTTAYILAKLLPQSYLLSNIDYRFHGQKIQNTTPQSLELAKALCFAKKKKYRYFILEISSIGIAENRVNNLPLEYFLITNIESDHLDYHKTLEEYQNTKLDYANSQEHIPVIYDDSPFLSRLRKPALLVHFPRYNICQSDKRKVVYKLEDGRVIRTYLLGEYNLRNIIMALTVLQRLKIYVPKSLRQLGKIKPLKGRSQVIRTKPLVVIDYAHTSSALDSLLSYFKKNCQGQLIVVFGAGGNRDQSKRQIYGQIVAKYADIGIISNDNPRDENPEKIVFEIKENNPFPFYIILDRRKAIERALAFACQKDIVLIVGKGHEEYQIIGEKKQKFSDRKVVKKWIRRHFWHF